MGGGGTRITRRIYLNSLVVTGQWSLVSGHWSLVSGQWSLVTGQWSVGWAPMGNKKNMTEQLIKNIIIVNSGIKPKKCCNLCRTELIKKEIL